MGLDRTQVRIGSDSTNERLFCKLSLCSRQNAVRSAVTRRCKFREFKLNLDRLFSWYVYFVWLIKFDTSNNSRDFKCTNIKDFIKFMIISWLRPRAFKREKPKRLVLTKLKAIQNPGLYLGLSRRKAFKISFLNSKFYVLNLRIRYWSLSDADH